MVPATDVDGLVEGIGEGSRSAISRAITLVESRRPDHREAAAALLSRISTPETAGIRLGISGVPGVGKSTFINALGVRLIDRGSRLAVLAVDPSSARTGGSILGDRTRMAALAQHDSVFIRPSPSGSQLGGVARATREAMLIVEAGGYDVVIVETVGVGQSEVAVAGMVDTFLMLALARSGDQLQGIKRGILEMADIVAVNKADGDNLAQARVCARELAIAMKLVAGGEEGRRIPPVLTCSAQTGDGIDDVWRAVEEHRRWILEHDGLWYRRGVQQAEWMWAQVCGNVQDALVSTPELRELRALLTEDVIAGRCSALDAARRFLSEFTTRGPLCSWGSQQAGRS